MIKATMSIEMRVFVRSDFADSEEFRAVDAIAERLLDDLQHPEVAAAIDSANQPTKSSAEVQHCLISSAARLGFSSERRGLFAEYQSGLRPDYYLQLEGTGVILEVERGKTTANNMDMLDFWKCHVCPAANYLFLFVPKALQHNAGMRPVNQFAIVIRRLSLFFERPANYTNVRGLFIFGY